MTGVFLRSQKGGETPGVAGTKVRSFVLFTLSYLSFGITFACNKYTGYRLFRPFVFWGSNSEHQTRKIQANLLQKTYPEVLIPYVEF